jgi:hypothetical protein
LVESGDVTFNYDDIGVLKGYSAKEGVIDTFRANIADFRAIINEANEYKI